MKVKHALLATGFAQQVTIGVTLVKTLIISRLLAPEEIGVFVIAMALMFFAQILRLFGTVDYIIAKKEINDLDQRVCFSIIAILSTFLYIALWFLSEYLSIVFDAPSLMNLLRILGIYWLINAPVALTVAMLTREMRMRPLAIVKIVNAMVDITVVLLLAWNGWGEASLAWGYTAAGFSTAIILMCLERSFLLRRLHFSGWGPVFRFGGFAVFNQALTHLGQHGPSLLLGFGQGPGPVGIFSRGLTPITFFRQGLEGATDYVSQSWFAATSRSEPGLLERNYLRAVNVAAGLAWPFAVVLYFEAPQIVHIMFGPQWQDSIPIAEALAIGCGFTHYAFYGAKLLTGAGKIKPLMVYQSVNQTMMFALLIAAMPFGLEAFAWAFAISRIISAALMWAFLNRLIGMRISRLITSSGRSALLATAIVCVQMAANSLDPHTGTAPDYLGFAFNLLATGLVWLVALWATRHPIWLEAQSLLLARRVKASRREKAQIL